MLSATAVGMCAERVDDSHHVVVLWSQISSSHQPLEISGMTKGRTSQIDDVCIERQRIPALEANHCQLKGTKRPLSPAVSRRMQQNMPKNSLTANYR